MLFCPSRDQGTKRSGVAIPGSEVSFMELIGGARAGAFPSSERAVRDWPFPFAFQNGAAWWLNLISRRCSAACVLCIDPFHTGS